MWWGVLTAVVAHLLYLGANGREEVKAASQRGLQDSREAIVTGLVGGAAELPCNIDVPKCGKVYFITWAKNVQGVSKRVYLYSDAVEKPLQELANPDRADFILGGEGGVEVSRLRISPLRPEDEGLYICDITYLRGKCPSLNLVTLTLVARPDPPLIVKNGREVPNGTTLGPLRVGEALSLACVVLGGKPAPTVTWWRRGEEGMTKLPSISAASSESVSNVTARLEMTPDRSDLGSRLECHASNPAVNDSLVTSVELDVHVPPVSVQVTEHTVQAVEGEPVLLTCVAEGARPAATLVWINGSMTVLVPARSHSDPAPDGTFRTVSELEITASRHDHLRSLGCRASHVAQGFPGGEAPLEDYAHLYVLYPPSVTVQPSEGLEAKEGTPVTMFCKYDANPANATAVRWFREDGELGTGLEYGLLGYPALTIPNVTRHHAGLYGCEVENEVGSSVSSNLLALDVFFPPQVIASITPESVVELEGSRVTLRCQMVSGNPMELLRVRWFKSGELVHDGREPDSEWINVGRNFSGPYACQGEGPAGWGPVSQNVMLEVHYLPGITSLVHVDEPAIKGRSATLQCRLTDPGNPPAVHFRWTHEEHVLPNRGSNLTIDPVALSSRGNYSCAAVNAVGVGPSAYFALQPKAPPTFVEKPPSKTGAPVNETTVSLVCRVECDPLCQVEWLRNGQVIDPEAGDPYRIKSTVHPVENGTFWSVVSTLFWQMDLWPGRRLDSARDNAHYTCRSSDNNVGPGVSATTEFRVEYPPEKVNVSTPVVHVVEGSVPPELHCTASAWPPADFIWEYGDEVIAESSTLRFMYSMPRARAGRYTCLASNRHGTARSSALIDVLYKPECTVYGRKSDKGFTILTCEADGNPPRMTFSWLRGNETLPPNAEVSRVGNNSVLTIPTTPEHDGTYFCTVKNSVGTSKPCSLKVVATLEAAGWIPEISDENLVLIFGIAAAIVIGFICIAIATFFLVKRKRVTDSPKNPLGKRENPDGRVQSNDNSSNNKPTLQVGPNPNKPHFVSFKKEEDDVKKKKKDEIVPQQPEPVYQNLPRNKPTEPVSTGPRMAKDGRRLYVNDLYNYMNREEDVPEDRHQYYYYKDIPRTRTRKPPRKGK